MTERRCRKRKKSKRQARRPGPLWDRRPRLSGQGSEDSRDSPRLRLHRAVTIRERSDTGNKNSSLSEDRIRTMFESLLDAHLLFAKPNRYPPVWLWTHLETFAA